MSAKIVLNMRPGVGLIEDNNCIDELLGEHQYRYELMREREAMLRSKVFADSEMEYSQGDYNSFSKKTARFSPGSGIW